MAPSVINDNLQNVMFFCHLVSRHLADCGGAKFGSGSFFFFHFLLLLLFGSLSREKVKKKDCHKESHCLTIKNGKWENKLI